MNKALLLALTGTLALAACAPTNTTSSGIPTTTVNSANGTVMASPANQSGAPAAAATTPGNAGASSGSSSMNMAAQGPTTAGTSNTSTAPATGTNQISTSTTTTLNGAAATQRIFQLTKQAAAPVTLDSNSTVTRTASTSTVNTVAVVRGLVPNTYYVAHYHLQGTANTNPCISNGPALMPSKIVGRSDATGNLRLEGNVALADVREATYFNVHTAVNAAGDPADAGVACAAVQNPQ